MKVLSPKIHGIIDYIVAIALLLAPNLFGFADVGGVAVMVPRVIGVLILAQALITKFDVGVLKIMPFSLHLMMDYVIGAVLAASPFIFGFNDQPTNVWLPHVVVGIMIIGEALMTDANRKDA